MIAVDEGTIVIFGDIACPWAHLAVHRLYSVRERLALEDRVLFDHRSFPLELINRRPTPKLALDAEVAVLGAHEPDAGWQVWQGALYKYPATTLPALEAVEAAKEQGLRASEQLDRALRLAFFAESKTICMRHVIEEVASRCDEVDAGKLLEALDQGRARAAIMEQARVSGSDEIQGSPHLFLPDGSNMHNPGIEMHWEGEHGKGFPVVDEDRPEVYEQLLQTAAGG